MLDGTLFIVKCARCGNPGKNVYQDFFMFFLHYNVRIHKFVHREFYV